MKTVAKTLLFDPPGNVLVLRRSHTHPCFAYHLDFPGGAVEDGECHHKAARREVIEETGLVIPLTSYIIAHKKEVANNTFHVVYIATISDHRPAIKLSWEHDKFEWMQPSKLLGIPIPDGADEYYMTALEYLRQINLRAFRIS